MGEAAVIAWLLAIALGVSITMTALLLIAVLWVYREVEGDVE